MRTVIDSTLPEIAPRNPILPKARAVSRRAQASRYLYLALFLSGFILRFGFVLLHRAELQRPGALLTYGVEVSSIAAHLARGQGFSSPWVRDTGPTAWIAPLYPFFVSLVFRVFGILSATSGLVILCIQCVIAAATAITIHTLSRRILGAQIGVCAAWIWALSPIFFRWPVSWIWDFTASAFLLCCALVVTFDVAEQNTRKLWLTLGGLWGIIALTNPALLSVLPFTLIFAIALNHRAKRQWFHSAALAGLLFAALTTPWLVRNEIVFHRPVFFRSNFWFEFHLGNYHYSNGLGFGGKHPALNPAELNKYASWGEMRYIDYYKQDSLDFVRNHPYEFISLTLHRTLWFWDGTPLPYQTREWWVPWKFWPLSLLAWVGLAFMLVRRPRGWLLLAIPVIVYPIPYYLVYPVAKYRYAIEPEMLLLSVYLAFLLWNEFRKPRADRAEQLRYSSVKPA